MITIAAPVKYNALDAGLAGALSRDPPDASGPVKLTTTTRTGDKLWLSSARGDDGMAARVIDHLRIDVLAATKHRQPRSRGGTDNVAPNPSVPADSRTAALL